jgi:Ulp1 family protease
MMHSMSDSDDDSADEAEQLAMLRAMHARKGNLPIVKQDLMHSLAIPTKKATPLPTSSSSVSSSSTPSVSSSSSAPSVVSSSSAPLTSSPAPSTPSAQLASSSSSSSSSNGNPGPGYYGITLTIGDVESTSNPKGWITDEIISFYMAYLEHHVYGSSSNVIMIRPTLSFMTIYSSNFLS